MLKTFITCSASISLSEADKEASAFYLFSNFIDHDCDGECYVHIPISLMYCGSTSGDLMHFNMCMFHEKQHV